MNGTRGTGEVDLEPLRQAFLNSGMRPADLARRLGWTFKAGSRRYADGPRVSRTLGLSPYQDGSGTNRIRRQASYAMAIRLAEALDVDPADVGL